jgi:hypothetical protein
MKQRGSTGVRKMSVKFYVLAGAVVATGFFAAGSAQSALVSGASQQLKLDRSASPVVQVNGQTYRKRSRVQRYYRHKRPPAGQYDYSYDTYPFHSYYGLRAWYPPTATFDYPLLW